MDRFTLEITALAESTDDAAAAAAIAKSFAIADVDALDRATIGEIELTDDNPLAIPLGGMSSVSFVAIKPIGNVKVRVRLTSADGSSQAVPVRRGLVVDSDAVPFTVIDVTRVAGSTAPVRVQYMIGKAAT